MVRDAGQLDKDYQVAAKQVKEPLMIEDGILYRKMKLWVPKDLVKMVLESEHDSKIVGHFGQDKTIELIRRNFW
jgi:DNA/RNA endonuclease G (NUC1)